MTGYQNDTNVGMARKKTKQKVITTNKNSYRHAYSKNYNYIN